MAIKRDLIVQKGEIMNQQEIDRLFEQHCSFGTDLESCEAECMTKDDFTVALQEAVAMARRQALEEAAALCSLAVASYADRMNMPGEARGAVACAAEIRALMAQEAGE